LTFDLELQARAEAVLARHDEGAERAAAVIDAETGDVLLLVGAPRVDEQTGEPLWRSVALFPNRNLALGSVVKPFVLLEHLDALRHGREAALEFPACEGAYPSVPRVRCDGIHGNAARDPVYALAHSCNVFFCHAATELQNEGLARAYARFGLCDPPQHEGADVVPSSVQRDIVGLRRGDHHRPGWFQESLARSRGRHRLRHRCERAPGRARLRGPDDRLPADRLDRRRERRRPTAHPHPARRRRRGPRPRARGALRLRRGRDGAARRGACGARCGREDRDGRGPEGPQRRRCVRGVQQRLVRGLRGRAVARTRAPESRSPPSPTASTAAGTGPTSPGR
jgi:cell division protein FtsI/penicillin-binding protein 2